MQKLLRLFESFHIAGETVNFSLENGDQVVILLTGDATINGEFTHAPSKVFLTKTPVVEVYCENDCNFSILKEL